MWGPTVGLRSALRRVARSTQDRGGGDVEGRTASGERHDVIDGQIACGVGVALVTRAPILVLATPDAEHAGAEPLPCPRAVQGVVPAAVRLAGVLSATASGPARDDTTDRAELRGSARASGKVQILTGMTLVTLDCSVFDGALRAIPERRGVDDAARAKVERRCRRSFHRSMSVGRADAAVYSPAVLRLRVQPSREPRRRQTNVAGAGQAIAPLANTLPWWFVAARDRMEFGR